MLQFADPSGEVFNPALLLGPIAGPTAPASATKSEHLTLPPDARLPDASGAAAAPLPSATANLGTEDRSAGIVGAPRPGTAPPVPTKAPPPGQQPRTRDAAAPAVGGPAGLIRRPGKLAPDLAPSVAGAAAASRQPPSGSAPASVPAPGQAPAPSTELVAWASKWEGPGQLLRSASVGLPPVSRSAAPAPSVGLVRAMPLPPAPMSAAGRTALAPSPRLGPNVQASVPVTTPVAAPALVTPKRTAILYTSDGV